MSANLEHPVCANSWCMSAFAKQSNIPIWPEEFKAPGRCLGCGDYNFFHKIGPYYVSYRSPTDTVGKPELIVFTKDELNILIHPRNPATNYFYDREEKKLLSVDPDLDMSVNEGGRYREDTEDKNLAPYQADSRYIDLGDYEPPEEPAKEWPYYSPVLDRLESHGVCAMNPDTDKPWRLTPQGI